MCIGEARLSRCIKAQQEISKKIEQYLDGGGSINLVPLGKSSVSLKIERTESGSLRWVDKNLHFKSSAVKFRSICG